jgi:transketolase N-terminal domain/subunit
VTVSSCPTGIIPEAELETYGFDDSRLPMSGMATYTPGMEMSGGSLGQGLTTGYGPSHQATEDLSLMRSIPGMSVVF